MGEFAGVVGLDGYRPDEAVAERLSHGINGVDLDPPLSHRDGPVLLIHRASRNSSDVRRARQPLIAAPGLTLVADVRLDEIGAIADQLKVDGADKGDDVTVFAAALARWGEAGPGRCYGDFAFATWDARAARLTLGRDALGVRTLYYATRGHFVAFATRLRALLSLPEISRELDELALADVVTAAPVTGERTLYRHILRVPPGSTVTFPEGKPKKTYFWRPELIKPIRYGREEDYVEEVRELLDRAVASRMPSEGPVVCHLSGGFDSAGVAATAARLRHDGRLTAYTRVAGAPHPYGPDERGLAATMVARYPNIDWVVVDDATPARRDREPQTEAALMGIPLRNPFGLTWFEPIITGAARSGATAVLTGDQGNSVLSMNGVSPLPGLFLRGHWIAGMSELKRTAEYEGLSLLRTARRNLLPPLQPYFVRRWRYDRRHGEFPWLEHCVASKDFLRSVAYRDHALAIGHCGPIEQPLNAARRVALFNENIRDLNGILRALHGVEIRDAYSDRRLVESTFAIPEDAFYRNGQPRWFARRVLADRVPAEILAQRTRGRQIPEWHFLANRILPSMAEAVERIAASPLASRVLDVRRMKDLLASWPKDAEAARGHELLHRFALQRGVMVGSFLCWIEDSNG